MFYIVLILGLSIQVNSYVLLQVSKDDQNRSNVDALIHKVVPSEQMEVFEKKIARKRFTVAGSPKRETENGLETRKHREPTKGPEFEKQKPKENKIDSALKEFVDKKPIFRANDFTIKPKLFNFRSNQEPSLVYEVDSKVIIRALQDFLSSKLVTQYMDEAAKRAAGMYKTLRS